MPRAGPRSMRNSDRKLLLAAEDDDPMRADITGEIAGAGRAS